MSGTNFVATGCLALFAFFLLLVFLVSTCRLRAAAKVLVFGLTWVTIVGIFLSLGAIYTAFGGLLGISNAISVLTLHSLVTSRNFACESAQLEFLGIPPYSFVGQRFCGDAWHLFGYPVWSYYVEGCDCYWTLSTKVILMCFALCLWATLWFLWFVWEFPQATHWLRYKFSRFVYWAAELHPAYPRDLRAAFRNVPILKLPVAHGHTHPMSAEARNAIGVFGGALAQETGLSLYRVQCSPADVKFGRAGSLSYYFSKDLVSAPKPYDPPPNPLLDYCDVDHYIEEFEYCLVKNFHPTLIYATVPEAVSGNRGERSFTFDENDVLITIIAGGAEYRHRLWNWTGDILAAAHYLGPFCTALAVYQIERRRVEIDHQLIFLIPIRRLRFPFSLFAPFVTQPRLARLRVHDIGSGFNVLEVNASGERVVSVGRPQEALSSTMPRVALDGLKAVQAATTEGATVFGARTMVEGCSRGEAANVVGYVKEEVTPAPDRVVTVRGDRNDGARMIQVVQYGPYDNDAKPLMRAFMSPIVHAGFVPASNVVSEVASITERNVRDIPPAEITAKHELLMSALVEALTRGYEGTLVPVDTSDLFLKMKTPTQRRLLNQAGLDCLVSEAAAFLKKEAAVGKPKAGPEGPVFEPKQPRNIINPKALTKLKYGIYMHAFMQWLHDDEEFWYAPGQPCERIAAKVVRLAENAVRLCEADQKRMERHNSEALRSFCRRVYLRLLNPVCHADFLEVHGRSHHVRVRGTYGTTYRSNDETCSGMADTNTMGSLENLLVIVTAHYTREDADGNCVVMPKGFEAAVGTMAEVLQVVKKDSLVCTDDTLLKGVSAKQYAFASSFWGMEADAADIERGRPFSFLNKVYHGAWDGDPVSMSDPARAIAKFHLAVDRNVEPSVQACLKALGYARDNQHTPVLGPLVKAILRLASAEDLARAKVIEEALAYHPVGAYPHEPRDCFMEYFLEQIPEFNFDRFNAHIAEATSMEVLLQPPLCVDPAPQKSGMVEKDDLVTPPSAEAQAVAQIPKPPGAIDALEAQKKALDAQIKEVRARIKALKPATEKPPPNSTAKAPASDASAASAAAVTPTEVERQSLTALGFTPTRPLDQMSPGELLAMAAAIARLRAAKDSESKPAGPTVPQSKPNKKQRQKVWQERTVGPVPAKAVGEAPKVSEPAAPAPAPATSS